MNENDKKRMGERIRLCRNKLGISQEKLADLLGMKRTNIANYEAGRVVPPGNVLLEMAKTFETSTDYLLGRIEPKTIAAHHEGENWTEEELQEIEEFKQFIAMRRETRKNKGN